MKTYEIYLRKKFVAKMRKENINILHMAKISQSRCTIFIFILNEIYFSIFHFLRYLIFRVLISFLYSGAFQNYSDSFTRESSRMTRRRANGTKRGWTINETSGCHCAARQSARPSLLRKHWHSSVEFFSELVALAKIGHAR